MGSLHLVRHGQTTSNVMARLDTRLPGAGLTDFGARQAVRFALARNAVAQLDEAYKKLLAGKSVNEQIFRQNEILLEYQKLLLTIAYVPAPASPAVAAPAPAKQP